LDRSRRGQIDELKETQAALLRIKGGLSTFESEIAKQGGDWRKIFRQRARENAMAKELKLAFESDATTGQNAPAPVQPTPGQPQPQPGNDPNASLLETMFSAVTKIIDARQPSVPQTFHINLPRNGAEKTTVTKHDADGRIIES